MLKKKLSLKLTKTGHKKFKTKLLFSSVIQGKCSLDSLIIKNILVICRCNKMMSKLCKLTVILHYWIYIDTVYAQCSV